MTTKKAPAKKTAKDFAEKVAKKVTHEKVEVTTPDEVVNEAPEPVITVTEAPIPRAVKIPLTIGQLAQQAWDAVRAEDDADFAHCDPSFRGTLLYHAEAVERTGHVLPSDTALGRFEQELQRILVGGN